MNRTSLRLGLPRLSGLFAVLLPVSLLAADVGPTEKPMSPETVAAPAENDSSDPRRIEIERLWAEGRTRDALRRVKEWRKKERESPWPWVVEGELFFRQQRYKKAVRRLDRALELAPQMAEAYYWRGRAYEAMGKPLDAANEYRAAMMAGEPDTRSQKALERVLIGLRPTDG